MDQVSAQLSQEVRDAVTRTLSERQPLVHKLNADTSYLLQLPRPASASKRTGRNYYNVLIDPWLSGAQAIGASWFAQQWHAVDSAVKSIGEVEELAREIEILAGGLRLGHGRPWNGTEDASEIRTFLDAVVVSHEFTDHCHKETLLQVDPDVPILAPESAADLIRSWSHFRVVHQVARFPLESHKMDWRSFSLPPLPEWLAVTSIRTEDDAFNYHSAILITFSLPHHVSSLAHAAPDDNDSASAIIYTPHGISSEAVSHLHLASPPLRFLALFHGLHDVRISGQRLHLGAYNGLELQSMLNAKHWIGTHDGLKKGGFLTAWFVTRKPYNVTDLSNIVRSCDRAGKEGEGFGKQIARPDNSVKLEGDGLVDIPRFVDLGNGESFVLA